MVKFYFLFITSLLATNFSFAQNDSTKPQKKKSLFYRATQGIRVEENLDDTTIRMEKNEVPYLKFKNYAINSITIFRLDFNQDINDTLQRKKNFLTRVGNALHKNTKEQIIRSNLFFSEKDKINPYLIADNARYLRTLVFLQDAKIEMVENKKIANSVDVYVYTKDVFSIGISGGYGDAQNFNIELKEENVVGTAARLKFNNLYDGKRNPNAAYAAEFIKRNIAKSFADLTLGFRNYNTSFSTGKPEETHIFTKIEKQLISPYMPFTGSLEASYHKANNLYGLTDSAFNYDVRYKYLDIDGFAGFNLGTHKFIRTNRPIRLHKFIAVRAFHHNFKYIPINATKIYSYAYANISGVLASLNLLKQEFYKTKYIYGFGRQEDLPEGFNASLIAGWTNKENVQRPYYGLDFGRNYLSSKLNYYNFSFKLGGFINNTNFEDVDVLFHAENFTKLKPLSKKWSIRGHTIFGITQQINPRLNAPLFLTSTFGLEEFLNGTIAAKTRITLKKEMVFYNTWKWIGFKFAPFIFGSGSYLVQRNTSFNKGDLFSSLGLGIRSRNEGLIFGTMELRGYYFPRTMGDMQQFKIEFKQNLQYTYNSQYIKRPDFVSAN